MRYSAIVERPQAATPFSIHLTQQFLKNLFSYKVKFILVKALSLFKKHLFYGCSTFWSIK